MPGRMQRVRVQLRKDLCIRGVVLGDKEDRWTSPIRSLT